jgi:Deacetylase PdaC
MRRSIFLTLMGGLLAFIAGIVTGNSWHTNAIKPVIKVQPAQPVIPPPPPPKIPDSRFVFKAGQLTILAREVHLRSDRLRYETHVRYPQIASSKEPYIKKLNQRIKRLAVDHYQWMLKPSKEDLRQYKKTFPDAFNSSQVDYEIVLVTDSFLSIYLNSFDYGIGAGHSVQMSYVMNYDLKLHRELKLPDLFNPHTKYLEFIADYCTREMKLIEPLEPKATTFPTWNLTRDGIRFNFDACTVTGCADGARKVIIPFSALTSFLKPGRLV